MKKGSALIFLFAACCSACSGLDETRTVSMESKNLLLRSSHGVDGSAWSLSDCSPCHAISAIHQKAVTIKDIVRARGYDTCTGCHGENGAAQERQCVICHNPNDMPHKPFLEGAHSHNFIYGSSGRLTDANCVTCHESSDMDGNFELNVDLKIFPDEIGIYSLYASRNDFCFRCHNRDHQQEAFKILGATHDDPRVAIEENYAMIDVHGKMDGTGAGTYSGLRQGYSYGTVLPCSDCHSLHGTGNGSLLVDSSLTGASMLDPDIKNVPHQVDIANGDYSQLCVLCHDMETLLDAGGTATGNGLAGVHETGTDCRPCHTHGEAVQAGL